QVFDQGQMLLDQRITYFPPAVAVLGQVAQFGEQRAHVVVIVARGLSVPMLVRGRHGAVLRGLLSPMVVSWSREVSAVTSRAHAVSTIQANEVGSGAAPVLVAALTAMPSAFSPRVSRQISCASSAASGNRSAHASSTAMRRSSISSTVKSNRAATLAT